jgi:hypothetical protein
LLSIRAAVMFATGSTLVYFLQPVGATLVTATVFSVSALVKRPVLDRLAHEFCPFPAELSARLRQRHFFGWLSVVWSSAYVLDAAVTLWLLTNSSVSDFVLLKSVLSPLLTLSAIGASYVVLRIVVRHDDFVIRWGARPAPVLSS